jgi:hypothetical protein
MLRGRAEKISPEKAELLKILSGSVNKYKLRWLPL